MIERLQLGGDALELWSVERLYFHHVPKRCAGRHQWGRTKGLDFGTLNRHHPTRCSPYFRKCVPEKMAEISVKPDVCVLFGALRSGTTMLRLMIDGHPRYVCPGESDFIVDHLYLADDGSWRYDLEALAADRIFQASTARVPDTDEALPAMASMIADLRSSTDGCLVLVMHRGLERLLMMKPDIHVLHLLRDPRDVARSAIGMGWAGNVYYGATTWLQTEQEWETATSNLPDGQILEFHYETLLREPEKTLGNICAFLGDEYDAAMLDYQDSSTYTAVDASLAEQWRRKQTPKELGLIEPLFGDLLTKRGYEPSGHPQIIPGPFERLKLKFDDVSSVWRRRIARYGLRDPLIVVICGRLKRPKWARSAQSRIDTITNQHLK